MRRVALSLLLSALALLSVVGPAAAQSRGRFVQCSVGYVGGDEYVVMNYVTYDSDTWVRTAGSVCSDWIATGNWTGADMYRDWEDEGYDYICKVVFGPGEAVDVYAFPYRKDRTLGYQQCDLGEQLGGRIEYNDDLPPARDAR